MEYSLNNHVTLCVMLSWSLVDSDKDGKKTSDSEKQVRVTIQGGDGKKTIFISTSNVAKKLQLHVIFSLNHVTSYVMVSWPLVNSDNDGKKQVIWENRRE